MSTSQGFGQSSSSAHPGVPTWARGAANYIWDNPTGGIMPDVATGQQMMPFANYMAMLQPGLASLNGPNGGAALQRQIAAQLTGQMLPQMQGLAGQSATNAQQMGGLTSFVPQMLDTANLFANNIHGANQQFGNAFGAANQSLQNVMNPTMYNPLYQNAMQNQITPSTNAAFAARGLGSSGLAAGAIGAQGVSLSDQFAQRQFQEQQQAQGTLGGLAGAYGNMNMQAAQLPGQVYNQFMQGMGMGQQGITQAMQNQMMPLAGLGAGWQQYMQGVQAPLQMAQGSYGLSNAPLAAAMQNLPVGNVARGSSLNLNFAAGL